MLELSMLPTITNTKLLADYAPITETVLQEEMSTLEEEFTTIERISEVIKQNLLQNVEQLNTLYSRNAIDKTITPD